MSRMYVFALIFVILLERNPVSRADMTSLRTRLRCFRDVQLNCNEEFINVYPKLSKSVSGMQNATTWFLLYTRKNKEQPELLHKCGGKLPPNSNFNPKNRLIIIFTAFEASYCDLAIFRELTGQFLQREDANILVIDFSWESLGDYGIAVMNLKIITKQCFIVLKKIQDETGISSKQIYLVGHSLGGQLAGLLGGLWFRRTGSLFHRITALDAAAEGFHDSVPPAKRLDRTDAKFVDVWHTNAGKCYPFYGIDYDAGDVDFYINDGTDQPACVKDAFMSVLKGDYTSGFVRLLVPNICSHEMSSVYFKVSINPGGCQFVGVKCQTYSDLKNGNCRSCGSDGSNCAIIGYDSESYCKLTKDHQRYYLSTSLDCPYCDNSNIDLEGFSVYYNSSLQSNQNL